MRKVIIVELDVTSHSDSWIVALQKIDYEMNDKINKHIILRQRPEDEIINVPSYHNEPFVISVKEENRE